MALTRPLPEGAGGVDRVWGSLYYGLLAPATVRSTAAVDIIITTTTASEPQPQESIS
ncbi:MAG: hypothetical protein ABIL58_06525 [Pseudomonadota bacterium]